MYKVLLVPLTFLPEAGGWVATPHWSPACCSGPSPYGGLQTPATGRHPNPKTEQEKGAECTGAFSPQRGQVPQLALLKSSLVPSSSDNQPPASTGLDLGEDA